jgi:glucosylceramidase
MKDTGNMDGGSLLPEYWESFAMYELKFLQEYEQAGVKLDYLTIQNEAMAWQTFPSMVMLSTDQRDIIKKFFGPIFATYNITTKILVLDHNWDLLDYVLTVLGDPITKSYIGGVAWHCYGGKPNLQSVVHNYHPDVDAFFTECGVPYSNPDWAGRLVNTLDRLYVQSVNHWSRGVLHWNIILNTTGGPHVVGGGNGGGFYTILTNGTIVKEPEYYCLAHNSKFVDIGAFRIDGTSNTQSLSVVSYLNPDESFAVVVVNMCNCTEQFDIQWGTKYLTYELPSQSVATFTWK